MSTLVVNASIRNSATLELSGADQVTVTTTNSREDSGRYDVGTTEETITFSSKVVNAGYLVLFNHDATNFITWGPVAEATLAHPFDLQPGTGAVVGLVDGQASLFVKADTASCELAWKVFEK